MQWDVIIIGGGPAGASTALHLAGSGLNVLVIDKETFPRDKICGDAISAYTVKRLEALGIADGLKSIPKTRIDHIVFSSPDRTQVRLRFTPEGYENEIYGYVLRRSHFDHFLIEEVKKRVRVMEGVKVRDILQENGQVTGVILEDSSSTVVRARMIVGADGYHSIIARKMGIFVSDPAHWLVAVRAYFHGVQGMDSAIEMHFARKVNPGYFWIFPVEENVANVGLGMPLTMLRRRKIQLKNLLEEVIQDPLFRDRFREAKPENAIVGWQLPIATIRRKVNGNGFLLVGDAAGLVDPFSGEGIGNAIAAGRIAAETLQDIFRVGDFTEKTTDLYAERLWKKLGPEMDLSKKLFKLAHYPWLINYVLHRTSRSDYVKEWLSRVAADIIPRSELVNPWTYVRLLFK